MATAAKANKTKSNKLVTNGEYRVYQIGEELREKRKTLREKRGQTPAQFLESAVSSELPRIVATVTELGIAPYSKYHRLIAEWTANNGTTPVWQIGDPGSIPGGSTGVH